MYSYNVKITTVGGKSYSFKWKPAANQAMSTEPHKILLDMPCICVKKSPQGNIYVPQRAIDRIQVMEIDE